MMLTFVNSLYFLEYVFLVILNFQVLNDLMNSSSRQLVYLIILSFSMHCFESQLRGRETVRYFTSVAARISELATTENKSSWRPLGLVARSLVSANRWLRGIKMYRFPWYLTLVSTNHASSNPCQGST